MIKSFPPKFIGFIGALALAQAASAQTSTVCYDASLPLTPTDWMSGVTIPKFDPLLGTLTGITFTLGGHIEGTAAVENFSPSSPSTINTQFEGTLTLTRPDMSVIVITIPVANFTDVLTVFDGVIDFAGTSGETHSGVSANDSDTVVSPPPATDLVLFTGPGTITLPVMAQGTSSATGGGNIITSFSQSASATVHVCYEYLGNSPPTIDGPCGQTMMASAGVPFSFTVCASDISPTDTVTLTSGALPPGATLTPPLPATGNPICTTFNWTPTSFDVGTYTVCFTATDTHLRTSTCCVTLVIAECYQLVGRGSGNTNIYIGGTLFQTQLGGIRQYFAVTMADRPSMRVPMLMNGQLSFSVQTVMHNQDVFPLNPDQFSNRMRVVITPGGVVTGELFGSLNGIHQALTTFTDPFGDLYMTFPFTIDGM